MIPSSTRVRTVQRAPILPLTSVRIFAALYVVLHHAYAFTGRIYTNTFFGRFVENGFISVGFFFTLSGFILAFVYLNTDRPFNRRAFWTSRFARVYPLLFVSLLLDAPRYFIDRAHQYGHLLGFLRTCFALVSEAVLLQPFSLRFRNLNGPSWSLAAEAVFYLLFPFLAFWIWRARRWKALLLLFALWGCAMIAPVYVDHRHPELAYMLLVSRSQQAVELIPAFRIFEFLAGIALCALQLSFIGSLSPATRSRLAGSSLLCAVVLFLAAIQYSNSIPPLVMSDGFLLPVYCLTILGLVNVRGPVELFFSHRLLVLLGEASYAVYLFHAPVLLAFFALNPLRTPLIWTIYATIVLALSMLGYLCIERPARKWILARAAVRPSVALAQETVASS